jgi:hypothetical protein
MGARRDKTGLHRPQGIKFRAAHCDGAAIRWRHNVAGRIHDRDQVVFGRLAAHTASAIAHCAHHNVIHIAVSSVVIDQVSQ